MRSTETSQTTMRNENLEKLQNQQNQQNQNSTKLQNQNPEALVALTPTAVSHVKKILHQMQNAKGLRVGVKKSGCSGLSYVVDCTTEIEATDIVYPWEGVQIIVDAKSLPYLKGMKIDCVTEGLNQTLKFINPNATGACGCGESFSVDK